MCQSLAWAVWLEGGGHGEQVLGWPALSAWRRGGVCYGHKKGLLLCEELGTVLVPHSTRRGDVPSPSQPPEGEQTQQYPVQDGTLTCFPSWQVLYARGSLAGTRTEPELHAGCPHFRAHHCQGKCLSPPSASAGTQ